MWWLKALLIVFGIAWLVLLVDCLRRERFYPVLGPGIRTKILWLVTFVLFSPIQMVLYLVFGRLLKPRESAPTWARAGILVLVAAAAAFQLIPIGGAVRGPFSLVRDAATGDLLRQGAPDPVRLDVNASVLSSESNSSATSVVASGDHAMLMCRTMALLNLSDHPLLGRIGEELTHRIGDIPAVRKVDYYPAGTTPPVGTRRPDLLLTLDLKSIDETSLPAYRQLTAEVELAGSTDLWPGRRSHSTDSTTPPAIEVNWNYELQHRSQMVGYESADARYKMVAEQIAKEIGKGLSKQIGDWQEKYGLMEALPDGFYGPYREARDVLFAGDPGCRMMMSTFGVFEHNRTMWLIEDPRETTEALEAIAKRLETAGWKRQAGSDSSSALAHVTLRLDERSLHIFRERDERATPDKPAGRIVVMYREPVSSDARCAALAEWLDQKPSAEMILRFERMAHTCSADLRDRVGDLIEADPPSTGQAHLLLARRYERRGEPDQAKAAISRAVLFARAVGDYSELKSSLKRLARKLGDEGLATAPVGLDALMEAGFVELPAASDPFEAEVAVDEPVLAFARLPNDDTVMACVRVERSVTPDRTEPYRLRIRLTDEDGSSCATTISLHGDEARGWQAQHGTGLNDLRVQASVNSIGSDQFRVRVSGSREDPVVTTTTMASDQGPVQIMQGTGDVRSEK